MKSFSAALTAALLLAAPPAALLRQPRAQFPAAARGLRQRNAEWIALAAVMMGRLEVLGVEPGDPIPDELFDESRWN